MMHLSAGTLYYILFGLTNILGSDVYNWVREDFSFLT
jgi:hypothetical protein